MGIFGGIENLRFVYSVDSKYFPNPVKLFVKLLPKHFVHLLLIFSEKEKCFCNKLKYQIL